MAIKEEKAIKRGELCKCGHEGRWHMVTFRGGHAGECVQWVDEQKKYCACKKFEREPRSLRFEGEQ
jgi:hypothetical protein